MRKVVRRSRENQTTNTKSRENSQHSNSARYHIIKPSDASRTSEVSIAKSHTNRTQAPDQHPLQVPFISPISTTSHASCLRSAPSHVTLEVMYSVRKDIRLSMTTSSQLNPRGVCHAGPAVRPVPFLRTSLQMYWLHLQIRTWRPITPLHSGPESSCFLNSQVSYVVD